MGRVLDILKQTQAVITDSHFVLTSGKHSSTYINKDALYPHTGQTSEICRLFADAVKDLEIHAVIGPALGGIILSQWTAHHLTQLKGQEVFAVYSEKTADGGQAITRGYERFVRKRNVVVVEDLVSTGGSARKVVDAVRTAGGQVVAVVVMVNRNPKEVTAEFFSAPFFALETSEVEAYEEADFPLCKSGAPINTAVGHGKKYLEKKTRQ